MYKSRLGNRKNLKAEEWRWIDLEISRRDGRGKQSQVFLDGRPLTPSRVLRETARNRSNARRPKATRRISVKTPPPPDPPTESVVDLPRVLSPTFSGHSQEWQAAWTEQVTASSEPGLDGWFKRSHGMFDSFSTAAETVR